MRCKVMEYELIRSDTGSFYSCFMLTVLMRKHCLQYMYRKANRFLRAANQQITQMLREKKPLFQLVESSN